MWQEISVGSNFAIFAISSAIRKNKFLQIEIFFSRFAGMACVREAKDSRQSIDDIDGSFYSELWVEGW